MKVRYHCEICNSAYVTEEQAEACEKSHRTKETMEIRSVHYESCDKLWGSAVISKKRYPESITIKFSDKFGDFANYRLEHIGYTGV